MRRNNVTSTKNRICEACFIFSSKASNAEEELSRKLIGMDSANIRNMKILFGGDADYKIHKLLEFAGSKSDVVDPWYSGDFDKAYNDIEMGCNALLNFLLFENS